MNPQRCLVIFLVAELVCGLIANAALAAPVASSAARLTEAHGHVYKRGFIDWEREQCADPVAAQAGDPLLEGMQLGTGVKSWAEVSWPNISTRAWANSVYAVAPNRRLVYLTSGEMLYHLDKNRKDNSPYYVWTKLLSARIRGTTVLFQCTENMSRITVLEGCIDVTNRIDKSCIRLKPGVVYEVTEKADKKETAGADNPQPELPPITLDNATSTPLFETPKTLAVLKPVDANKIMNLPLLNGFTSPLTSLPLVQQAMTSVSGLLNGAISLLTDTKLLKSAVEIVSVPMALDYKVDRQLISIIPLPQSAISYFPPTGIIGGGMVADASLMTDPQTGLPSAAGVGITNTAGMPIAGAVPSTGTLTSAAGLGNVVPVTGALLTPVTGTLGTLSGSTTVLSGATNTLTGTSGSVLGGTSNLLGGTVNTLTNTLSGSLSKVTGLLH